MLCSEWVFKAKIDVKCEIFRLEFDLTKHNLIFAAQLLIVL
jgi:hypothetical protein